MHNATLFDNTPPCSFKRENPPLCTGPVIWQCDVLNVYLCHRHLEQLGCPCCACPHFDLCAHANPRLTRKKDSNPEGNPVSFS